MQVIRDAEEMRGWSRARRKAGENIGLVPTMGTLHEGHLSLMRECAKRDDARVVSIFVNPTQFAPDEDFESYPRDFESDFAKAQKMEMHAIYLPSASAMYPKGYASYVEVEGLQAGLCGNSRPHFFRGVATVVTKLFNAVKPDRAYFGQKDAQQASIIRRMTRDLDFGIEIVVLPIVREKDGLAMSSRNAYLSESDRKDAAALSRSLSEAESMLKSGERDAKRLVDTVRAGLKGVEIDYVELVDADEVAPLERVEGKVLLAVAAKIGTTRLIDNIIYEVQKHDDHDV